MSTTILHRLASWANEAPDSAAQRFKKAEKWETISAREFRDRVYWLALFLESRGMTSQDVGAIFSYNCPQWVHLELAALLLGAKSTGIYPNSISKEAQYVLEHTESRFLSIQNKEYFHKLLGEKVDLSCLNRVQCLIVFDNDTSFSPLAVSYASALDEGKRIAATQGVKKFEDYLSQLDPRTGAFIIYTSGTTGKPKGAMLSHDNLCYTVDAAVQNWKITPEEGTLFSFLPLCHVAETMQNIGGGITQRYPVSFCSKFENVSKELPEVEPRLLLCVPRVWEKMMEGVLHKIDHSFEPQKQLAKWALKRGEQHAALRIKGKTERILDWAQWKLADLLVLSKIRKVLGLAQAEVIASGAAPLPVSVCQWFRSIGLDIMEIFGQTESTGIICMTLKDRDCAGSVGQGVDGLEVKIAPDGELMTRGRHVFTGYYKDEAATAQVLQEGWLHTGDLVEIDSRKLIRIRGRKKEILKTSGGKMIAPAPIEDALKASPWISQVCMVGDGKKYLSALITLTESKLAEIKKLNAVQDRLITSPGVVQEVRRVIDQVNSGLSSYEQIKKFAILGKEFSVDSGEMTPTLKMKRNVIETQYQDVIQQLYGSS